MLELPFPGGIDIQVEQGGVIQVSPLEQHGARSQSEQGARRFGHVAAVADAAAQQGLGFGQVRGQHPGRRQQVLAQRCNRAGFEQVRAR